MDFDAFVDSLPTEIEGRVKNNEVRHPCGQCAGTGKYQGARIHQPKSECFACRGRGYFMTSAQDRAKSRAAAADRKRAAIKTGSDQNIAQYGDILNGLQLIESWNTFAQYVLQDHRDGKLMHENRMKAAQSMLLKIAQRNEAKAVAAAATVKQVDLSPIREMFNAAVNAGMKKPSYRAEGIKLTLAPASGRNGGALYVVKLDFDTYQGKIIGTDYKPVREACDSTYDALLRIAANPLEAAVRYGRKTGTCACCGRKLDNALSIELGIGPICRQKWSL